MSTPSNTMSDTAPAAAAATLLPTRPFYWSVKRELWENRSLYIAPMAVAALILFGFIISVVSLARHGKEMRAALKPEALASAIILPYDIAAVAMILISVIVGFFYAINALYSERRERSILFWKSLPVSNLTTVLSKAFMPIIVLPAVVFAVTVVLHIIMLLLNSVGRAAAGLSVAELWAHVPLVQMEVVLLYGVATLALWHAPIYAYLIFVSSWVKKTPILWAVLPPLALVIVEKIAFGTNFVGQLINYRLGGAFEEAFSPPAHTAWRTMAQNQAVQNHAARGAHHPMQMPTIPSIGLAQLDLGHFLSSPGLWLGLIAAAAFLAGAMWMRRTREAI
jgi:ABC-2 type transport system permease protein